MESFGKYYAESNIGGRNENQDTAACVESKFGLLGIVCDGMGGGNGGKLASETAIDVVIDDLKNSVSEDPVNAMYNAIQKANFEVFRKGLNDKDLKGMGTTIVLVLVTDREALVAHVGDSRLYQFRKGKAIFRTDDHSVVFRMLKDGILTSEEQARNHPKSNEITRALGLKPVVDIEVNSISYLKDDYFFICSDGINGELDDQVIADLHGEQDPKDIVNKAIQKANLNGNSKGGGHDNASAVSIKCYKDAISPREEKGIKASGSSSRFDYKNMFMIIVGMMLCIAVYSIIKLKSNNSSNQEQLKLLKDENGQLLITKDSLMNQLKALSSDLRDNDVTVSDNEEENVTIANDTITEQE